MLQFPTLLSALRHVSAARRPTYYGTCSHCERTTPWITNPLRGIYHCTECGEDALKPAA